MGLTEHLCRLSTPIVFFLHSWAKSTVWISNRLVKAFSRYWTEIKFQMAQIHPVNFKVADRGKHSRVMESKFKMAAMAATLEKMRHPFSIGYVSFFGPIHPVQTFSGNGTENGVGRHRWRRKKWSICVVPAMQATQKTTPYPQEIKEPPLPRK